MTGMIDALYKRVLLAAHPVGSIYQSTDATSPAKLFGGTWTAIESRFLLAASSTYPAGSTGGEAKASLNTSNLPSLIPVGYSSEYQASSEQGAFLNSAVYLSAQIEGFSWVATGQNAAPFSTMPPYYTVYTWQRTA